QKTAVYRLLSETKLGTLLEDLAIQAIHVSQEMFPATIPVKGVDAVGIVKRIARNGLVVAVFGKPREPWGYLAVLRQCDRPEIRSAITSVAANLRAQAGENAEFGSIEKGGRTLYRLGTRDVWWAEKGDLILSERSEADEILDVIDGRRPSA